MSIQKAFALSISLVLILLIPNIAFAQQTHVTVSGYVRDNNGAPVENAWVSFYDPVSDVGAGNQTLSDGSYTILIPTGTYNLDVFPQDDESLESFFESGIVITGDMEEFNIILVPRAVRAEIADTNITPQTIAQGGTGNVQFSMNAEDGSKVTGLVDTDFEIWIHDWSDPDGEEWWNERNQNAYHIDLTNLVIVSEVSGQPGNYHFTFILPVSIGSSNSWAEIQIINGNNHGWVGFAVVSATAVELYGQVTTIDGIGIANIGVGLWNSDTETGAWSVTDSTGFFSMLAEPGTYNLNAWSESGDLGGFFLPGFILTTRTEYNIVLTPRVIFSEVELSPRSVRQGEDVSASFSITDEANVPLTGVRSDLYSIWIHNWGADPSENWWENRVSNQYHQDISENVEVIEDLAGSYRFSFAIPSGMDVTGGWLDLEIRLGDSGSWAGIQVSSTTAVKLSGFVKTIDGSGMADVEVGLWDPATETGAWSRTDSTGFYSMLAEPGTYNLNAWSQSEDLGGYFLPGFTLITDTNFTIVFTPRAIFSEVEISPQNIRLNDPISVSFSLTDNDEILLSGIPDSSFNIWIHNWGADPSQNWWETHIPNQYHQDLGNDVEVLETITGTYGFSFSVPSDMNVSGGWLALEIRLGDSSGWAGLQIASGNAVELRGWVKTTNGTTLADIEVGLWNSETETGAWSITTDTGFFSMLAEPGTYNLNAWSQSEDLGGFFLPSFTLTTDTEYNITLTPRVIFSKVEVDPKNSHIGDTVLASFKITDDDRNPLTGVLDNSFTVWLHNEDADSSGNDWWKDHVSNQYHQDISENVNVVEGVDGSYSFSFTIPSIMNVTGGRIGLEIRLGESGGWTGIQVASANAVELSGWVKASNDIDLADIDIGLWNPNTDIGAGTNTDSSGYYSLWVEPGVYMLFVGSESDEIVYFFKPGFTLTSDTRYNITLNTSASFSSVLIDPSHSRIGDIISASFDITDGDSAPMAGILDDAFSVWIHNWEEDPNDNWWENPVSNAYHQDISDDVNVVEGVPGSYSFSFTIPSSLNVDAEQLDLEIRLADSMGWAGLHVASENAVEFSGRVTTIDDIGLEDVEIGLWDPATKTGTWSETDSSGFFLLLVEPGTYNLEIWPRSDDLSGTFMPGFTIPTDIPFNIVLTPRAFINKVQTDPSAARPGDIITASFKVTDDDKNPLTGVPDSSFTVWLHNWEEDTGDNWWENPVSNAYHQDISDDVNVVEGVSGSYSFLFTIPSIMDVSEGWLGLEIRLGNSGGWAGIQVASESAVELSGFVVAEDGSGLANVGVVLVDVVNNKDFFIKTEPSGHYALLVEPGVYTLMAKGDEELGGYKRIGFSLTSDTTWDITLIQRLQMIIVEPFPEPFDSTESVTITLEVYDNDDSLITGLLDSEFNIWIHNHDDPNDWKENPIQNNYHQDISSIIIVTEISPGKYSFTFTIPDGIDVDPKMMSLNIHLAKNGGWVSSTEIGLPVK